MSTPIASTSAAPAAPATRTKAAPRRARGNPRHLAWGIASVVLLAVGSLGTWATIGPVSLSGTSDGRDGIVTLILAGIAVVPFLVNRAVWIALACGVLALATTIYDIVDISTADTIVFSASPGWGIYLAAAAALSLCVWPFFARRDPA